MSDHLFEEPGLTDKQLNEVLHAVGEDVLAHVRATGNPTAGLLALMEQGTAAPTESAPCDRAATVITARAQTEDFSAAVREAALTIRAYEGLATTTARRVEIIEKARERTTGIIEALEAHDHARAREFQRALYVDIARDLTSTRDFERELERATDGALERNLVRAIEIAHDLGNARDRVVDLAPDADHNRTRENAFAVALALDLARVRSLALALAVDLALVGRTSDLRAAAALVPDAAMLHFCGVDPALRPMLGSDWDPRTADLQAVERDMNRLRSALNRIPVDASSSDLSGLELDSGNLHALNDVMWTACTRWPAALRPFVEHNSRQIGDGIYQVSPGTTHDKTGTTVLV